MSYLISHKHDFVLIHPSYIICLSKKIIDIQDDLLTVTYCLVAAFPEISGSSVIITHSNNLKHKYN